MSAFAQTTRPDANGPPLPTSGLFYGIPASDLAHVHEVCRIAGGSGRLPVIIAGTNPDFDSAGAALGIALYLSKFFRLAPFIVSGPAESRLTTAGFRPSEPQFFTNVRNSEGDPNIFYVLVDAPSTADGWGWPKSYGPPPIPDLVIDHHTGATNGKNSLITSAARATSILTLALLESRDYPQKSFFKNRDFMSIIAPLMLAGIMIDNGISTDNGSIVIPQEASPVVVEAIHKLNLHSLQLIPIDDVNHTPPIFRHMLRNALCSQLLEGGPPCAVACVGKLHQPAFQIPMAARIVKEMRYQGGLTAAVLLAFFERESETVVRLLVRTNPEISASEVVEELFGIGTGGGNGQQAGGELPLKQLLELYNISELPEPVLIPDVDNRYIGLEKKLLPLLLAKLRSMLKSRSSLPTAS